MCQGDQETDGALFRSPLAALALMSFSVSRLLPAGLRLCLPCTSLPYLTCFGCSLELVAPYMDVFTRLDHLSLSAAEADQSAVGSLCSFLRQLRLTEEWFIATMTFDACCLGRPSPVAPSALTTMCWA